MEKALLGFSTEEGPLGVDLADGEEGPCTSVRLNGNVAGGRSIEQ